jgi:hypothetical protein
MVAPATPRLGFEPHVNLARCFLHRAYDALNAGNLFQAGCLLRESVRRQLFAECAWKSCLPDNANDRTTPTELVKAQRNAGIIGESAGELTRDIIRLSNRLAHCRRVDASEIRTAIAIWHMAIDGDPCGEPAERVGHCKPVVEGPGVDDCDDDDDADWWKPGGWQFEAEGGAE